MLTQRRPRVESSAYLRWIRSFPCVVCGTTVDIEAAHVRYASYAAGKMISGLGMKPHDAWTLPLCANHHHWGPDAQHRGSEVDWWKSWGIDPIYVAALMWLHYSLNDDSAAYQVATHARQLGK